MLGQLGYFTKFAPEKIPAAIQRYTKEAERLLGVLDKRLAKRKFVCGELSIADFALLGWVRIYHRLDLKPEEAPNVVRWIRDMEARPATRRGLDVKVAEAGKIDIARDKEAWKLLFTQGARA